jgi:hypothetical protein
MTRAKRYANHAGGRKYDKESGKELGKSSKHKDAKEKLEAAEIFKDVWKQCREHEGYLKKKEEFQKEQRKWEKEQKEPEAAR